MQADQALRQTFNKNKQQQQQQKKPTTYCTHLKAKIREK